MRKYLDIVDDLIQTTEFKGPRLFEKAAEVYAKEVQEEQIENDCFCIEQNTDMEGGNCYINPTTLKKETRRVIV